MRVFLALHCLTIQINLTVKVTNYKPERSPFPKFSVICRSFKLVDENASIIYSAYRFKYTISWILDFFLSKNFRIVNIF